MARDTIIRGRISQRGRAAVIRVLDNCLIPTGESNFHQYREGWDDEKVALSAMVGLDEEVCDRHVQYMREQAYGPFPPAVPKAEKALADRVALLEKLQKATADELAATRASCAAMQVHINHLYRALGEPMPIGPVVTNGDARRTP